MLNKIHVFTTSTSKSNNYYQTFHICIFSTLKKIFFDPYISTIRTTKAKLSEELPSEVVEMLLKSDIDEGNDRQR